MTDKSSDNRSNKDRRASDRERLENPRTGTQYVRRDEDGRFEEAESVSRAASSDQRRDSTTESRRGQGDRGDREPGTRSESRDAKPHSRRDESD
jgi:hypothetical protein